MTALEGVEAACFCRTGSTAEKLTEVESCRNPYAGTHAPLSRCRCHSRQTATTAACTSSVRQYIDALLCNPCVFGKTSVFNVHMLMRDSNVLSISCSYCDRAVRGHAPARHHQRRRHTGAAAKAQPAAGGCKAESRHPRDVPMTLPFRWGSRKLPNVQAVTRILEGTQNVNSQLVRTSCALPELRASVPSACFRPPSLVASNSPPPARLQGSCWHCGGPRRPAPLTRLWCPHRPDCAG